MRRLRPHGFTLIELMIVVAILGILAAVAVPSFVQFIRKSKAAESYDMLKSLYTNAATYYIRENFTSGLSGTQHRSCTVPNSDSKITEGQGKQQGDYSDPGFHALGFSQGATYFKLSLVNEDDAAGRCSVEPNTKPVYSLRATGDLDGDGVTSLIELAVGSDADNELYRAPAFYTDKETE